jgi:hypothetical protein
VRPSAIAYSLNIGANPSHVYVCKTVQDLRFRPPEVKRVLGLTGQRESRMSLWAATEAFSSKCAKAAQQAAQAASGGTEALSPVATPLEYFSPSSVSWADYIQIPSFLCIPMDFYGFLWMVSMDSYGLLWIPMDSYGFLWIPKVRGDDGKRQYQFLMVRTHCSLTLLSFHFC